MTQHVHECCSSIGIAATRFPAAAVLLVSQTNGNVVSSETLSFLVISEALHLESATYIHKSYVMSLESARLLIRNVYEKQVRGAVSGRDAPTSSCVVGHTTRHPRQLPVLDAIGWTKNTSVISLYVAN